MRSWTGAIAGFGRSASGRRTGTAAARDAARRRLPRAVFDFVDGGADDESALRRNRAAFEAIELLPRVLVGTQRRDRSIELFGRTWSAPFAIGPTGLAGMVRPGAEPMLAKAAARAGIPFTLSVLACATIEEVAACGNGPKWFQLYVLRDRGLTHALAARALAAGYEALVVTADAPVVGRRERDGRNDFSIPMRITVRNAADILSRPGWLIDALRAGPPIPVNLLDAAGGRAGVRSLAQFAAEQLDPMVNWDDIAELRRLWPRTFLVKGVLAEEDVRRAIAIGADGVIASNHGGRQLDSAPAPITRLPLLAEAAAGKIALLCDSGFRRGSDVIKALALGADGVLLGRAPLYGVAADGEDGALEVLDAIGAEIDTVLALLGCHTIGEVGRQHLAAAADASV